MPQLSAAVSRARESNYAVCSSSAPPKAKRVVFALEANTRTRNRFGADVYSQILHMILDGLTIEQIAETIGCCVDVVSDLIAGWQMQVVLKEKDGWEPKLRNPRKTRFRQSPSPKY